ncbi:A-kinase anchor protein 17A isoform X1 [Camellia sinensis]|uniref:A-kinase anchor protein 17A isoform X1 n=1 Tax=Camellia sinensis TaxID=4442 RepID=UPI001036DC1C|nr:A-kinase anchor protein 17A isoform X1 [Camellia sinensis]
MTNPPSSETLRPTETLEIENGLSLVPRVKLLLTIHRADHSVKPLDEWQLKRSLTDFLKSSFSLTVPEDDIVVRRFKDLKKRKRDDPVAHGALFIRDLGFLSKLSRSEILHGIDGEDDVKELEKKFLGWRRSVVDKTDGIELSLEGVKFRLTASVPESDDFDGMTKEWEELNAFGNRGYSRGGRQQQPDTIVLKGVPSRWFAEPRVSSKPSMLVTHTIFSAFGKIRNLNVAENDDLGKNADEDSGDIVSGLQCKIVVQFEKYKDFCTALKVLCGRSLQKQGSRLKADYEVTWDKDGFFRYARNETQEKSSWMPPLDVGNYRSEAPRRQSHFSRFSPDNVRSKRFKVGNTTHNTRIRKRMDFLKEK